MPGRWAAEAQAVQAKNAVSWRSSRGSVTAPRASPPFFVGLGEVVSSSMSICSSNACRARRQSQRAARRIVSIGLEVERDRAVHGSLLLGSKVGITASESALRAMRSAKSRARPCRVCAEKSGPR